MGEYVRPSGRVSLFHKTVTFPKAGSLVSILSNREVGQGKVYIQGMAVKVTGATAWVDSTATKVSLVENDLNTELVAVAKAGLTDSALLFLGTANVTVPSAKVSTSTGLSNGKGFGVVADAAFNAGSDLSVTVWGVIKTE